MYFNIGWVVVVSGVESLDVNDYKVSNYKW